MMNTNEKPFTAAFIIDSERRPLGIVHLHDLLRAGVA